MRLSMSAAVGDALPDAPELAHRGAYSVGVRAVDFERSEKKKTRCK